MPRIARALVPFVACVLLAGAGSSASPARRAVAAYSDTVFLSLGRGGCAEADRSSADWLAGTVPRGSQRAAALQTRLDVMLKPAGRGTMLRRSERRA